MESPIAWLEKQLNERYDLPNAEPLFEEAKRLESQKGWRFVSDETPPKDIELLAKSKSGTIHLCHWRSAYDIFTCQEKRESAWDWQWRLID